MGINERKDKEKLIRSNDIIDAAERVFFLKGYDLATMDDVAKEAEFSKRTVYVYFNSKEQIYFEIMVRGYKILLKMLEEASLRQENLNALDRLELISKTIYQFNMEYPNYFNAIMSYETGEKDFVVGIPDSSREECYALGEKLLEYIKSALKDGVEEGTIRSDIEIVDMAIILWSYTIGLFNTLTKKKNYIEHYHNRSFEELIYKGLDMMLITIKNK